MRIDCAGIKQRSGVSGLLNRLRPQPAKVHVLRAVMVLGLAVLVWSGSWNWNIGIHASDTNTAGGNTAAWLWFLGSFAVFMTSFAILVVMGSEHRGSVQAGRCVSPPVG
jgi:hypothetical protein